MGDRRRPVIRSADAAALAWATAYPTRARDGIAALPMAFGKGWMALREGRAGGLFACGCGPPWQRGHRDHGEPHGTGRATTHAQAGPAPAPGDAGENPRGASRRP